MSRGPEGAAAPHLPSVDRVLGWARVAALLTLRGRSAVLEAVRAELAARRPLRRHRAEPGADLGTFSGDKLLGGPQAPTVVRRADLVAAIHHNPMEGAMHCDKLTLAALRAPP